MRKPSCLITQTKPSPRNHFNTKSFAQDSAGCISVRRYAVVLWYVYMAVRPMMEVMASSLTSRSGCELLQDHD